MQGLHSTGHLQHTTQELAVRVTTLTHSDISFKHFARVLSYIFTPPNEESYPLCYAEK